MKGAPIPPPHYVARHCRYNDLIWLNGQATGVNETAFMPRPGELDGLSVNWVDYFQGPKQHKLDCTRSVTKLQAKDSHRIALLQVDNVLLTASQVQGTTLTVVEDPEDSLPPKFNSAHALIKPAVDLNSLQLRQRLATLVMPSDLFGYK